MARPLPASVIAVTGGDPQAVRAHILAAARRVIETRGLAATSTRAIAEESGLSGAALYNYFGSRLDLVAGAVVDRAASLTGAIAGFPDRAGRATIADNLSWFVGTAVGVLDELVPLFAAAFSDPELMAAVRTRIAALSTTTPLADPPGVVAAYLRAEQRLGRVRPDADCRAAALLVTALCHEDAFHNHLAGGGHRSAHQSEIALLAEAVSNPEPLPEGELR
jgi:AcrR family transcriptional regulator